jgi:hypothetical protein
MEHFQNVAEGHFTVRRLERTYGCEVVEAAYRAIEADQEPTCVSASTARAAP